MQVNNFSNLSKDKRLIKEEIEKRKIQYVVHFTSISNIWGILKHGIVPVSLHSAYGIRAKRNDFKRYDGFTEAISLSISFPNYRMFNKVRQENKDDRWVVLLLDPSILWLEDCAFNKTNAASKKVKCVPVQQRKNFQAFLSMFDNIELREKLNLPMNYTTDPQAEVLVFNTVSRGYIKWLVFENEEDASLVKSEKWKRKTVFNQGYFGPRFDYQYWTTKQRAFIK
ncbi:DarT ssDNA thymidine ADP-ribosyltransferase family protein [Fervidobacterium sp.]